MKFLENIGNVFTRYRNLRVVILCLVAATTFWFFNALNETYSTNIAYPVTFDFDREEYVVMRELPDEVSLNLQGIGWDLFRKSLGIKVTPLRIYLENPSDIQAIPGSSLPALISDQLDEFQLNYVITDSLQISIDRRVSQIYKVKIDSANVKLAPDYIITSEILYYPDSVFLIGPSSIITQLSDTLSIALPDKNIDEDYNKEVVISLERNDLIQRSPQSINVMFNVDRVIRAKVDVVVQPENFPDGLALSDSVIDVTIELTENDFTSSFNSEDISITAPYSNFQKEDSIVYPQIKEYPEIVRDISIDSSGLRVVTRRNIPSN